MGFGGGAVWFCVDHLCLYVYRRALVDGWDPLQRLCIVHIKPAPAVGLERK